ncbi:MAG: redox-sensing transcriptional repressor Rex [Oscillospiraceae bacterium]|jgi:redox-sensing transcriptional repressor
MPKAISAQALQRLPLYLQYLKTLPDTANISARALGAALGFGEIQVRKDLAAVSDGGRPKLGYVVSELRHDIACFLGYDNVNDAVLVGAGRLGRALLSYDGFSEYGLNIVAAFDADPAVCGRDESGKYVFPLEKLPDLCERMKIEIGIVTVPAAAAQGVCDMLCRSGIRAIWNFAPAHLSVPAGVLLKNENMAASLAVLSQHLAAEDTLSSDNEKEKAT